MPGETTIKIKELGEVVEGVEFRELSLAGIVRPAMEFKQKSGNQYAVMLVDGIGLAIGSRQTERVFIITARALLNLALEAGVDERGTLIVLPGGEVARG